VPEIFSCASCCSQLAKFALSSPAAWSWSEEQRAEAVQQVGEYAMTLVGDGALRGGALLHPAVEAKKIRSRDGMQRVLDRPFAESKEVIAGYFIIEAPDTQAAVAVSARCPSAGFGSVEVRQIVPMG
jgi:hypothetical protein